jgi:hypothetical protein
VACCPSTHAWQIEYAVQGLKVNVKQKHSLAPGSQSKEVH